MTKTSLREAESYFAELEVAKPPATVRKSITSQTDGFAGSRNGMSIDSFGRRRWPTPQDLSRELKNIAWTCASINAATCASFPPRLFVQVGPQLPQPKCLTKALGKSDEEKVRAMSPWLKTNANIQEILDHPYLYLINRANPMMNQQELLEYTTLYADIFGVCYWYIIRNMFGMPTEIWPFSPLECYPCPQKGMADPMNLAAAFQPDYYDLILQTGTIRIADPQAIIEFRHPDPRNPFRGGLSPFQASWESITLNSEALAYRQALWENRARPDAIVTPSDVIGPDERERMEEEFNSKFRRGGSGKVMVTEASMQVHPLSWPMNETALSGDHYATKEDICNAFGVPMSYVTKETNMANLQASNELYMGKAIKPRLNRRDQKITERLLPMYDPSGRLFAAAEDPVPEDVQAKREANRMFLQQGVKTINDVRAEEGLPPQAWGHIPWLPTHWAQADPNNPNRNVYDRSGYGGFQKPEKDAVRMKDKYEREGKPDKLANEEPE